jgi:hypothetical protein
MLHPSGCDLAGERDGGVEAPGEDARPGAVPVVDAEVAAAGNHVGGDLERLSIDAVGARRAVGIVVGADDSGFVADGGDQERCEIGGRREAGDVRPEDVRARRTYEEHAVDAFARSEAGRVVKPCEHGERVAQDDPLAVSELGELGADELEPALEAGAVGFWELRVEDDLAPTAELLGEPVLPVLGRAAVLGAVQDQKATPSLPCRRACSLVPTVSIGVRVLP